MLRGVFVGCLEEYMLDLLDIGYLLGVNRV